MYILLPTNTCEPTRTIGWAANLISRRPRHLSLSQSSQNEINLSKAFRVSTMLASRALLRRGLAAKSHNYTLPLLSSSSSVSSPLSSAFALDGRRWKSDDAGDVIGIDLGTTNSCVAIMVRTVCTRSLRRDGVHVSKLFSFLFFWYCCCCCYYYYCFLRTALLPGTFFPSFRLHLLLIVLSWCDINDDPISLDLVHVFFSRYIFFWKPLLKMFCVLYCLTS